MQYKTAVITGASRGLGKAIAAKFAERRLNVFLASRSESDLRSIVQTQSSQFGENVAYKQTDLTSADSISAMIESARNRFGKIDVLINNAGIGTYKPLVEWTEREIIDTVNVNLTALILASKAVLPEMIAEKKGLIVNIASDLSRRFLANMAPYVATKFAVLGFSGSLLREVKQFGVKVCTVMPGIIDTNFNNSKEGTREETWALPVSRMAEVIASLLDQPEHLIMDEIVVHPLQQDF